MFRNKKALTGPIILAIVLALMGFIIIFVIVLDPVLISKGPSMMGDQACKANNALDNAINVAGGHPVQTWFCPEREIKDGIKGDNWKACDPDGSKGWEKASDLKSCAQQQIFDYALRCWEMFGRGHWNLGVLNWDFDCFRFKLSNMGGETIDEISFVNFLKEQDLGCSKNFDDNRMFAYQICSKEISCGNYDNIEWEYKVDEWSNCKVIPMKTTETWEIKFADANSISGDDQIKFVRP